MPPVPGFLSQAARRANGEPRVRAAVSRRRRRTERRGRRRGERRGLEPARGARRARLRVVRVRREGLRRGGWVYVFVWTARSCMYICVHALLPPRRELTTRLPSSRPPPPSPLPRTSSICRSRSDLCHSSLLGVAGVASPRGARGSYREESDSERGFRRWEGLEGGAEGIGGAVQGQRRCKCARGTLGCA